MGREFGMVAGNSWRKGLCRRIRSKPLALSVMFYLTTTDTGMTTGIFHTTVSEIAEATGLSREDALQGLEQSEQAQCVRFDPETSTIYIPEQAGWAYGPRLSARDKRVKGIKNLLAPFRDHPFADDFLAQYGERYNLTVPSTPPQAAPAQTAFTYEAVPQAKKSTRADSSYEDFAPDCAGWDEAPSEALRSKKNDTSERENRLEGLGVVAVAAVPSETPVREENKTTTISDTVTAPMEREAVVVVDSSRSSRSTPSVDLRSVTDAEKEAIGELWLLWQKTFERADAEFDRTRNVWLVDAVRTFGAEDARCLILGTVSNKFLMGDNRRKELLVEPRHIFGCAAEHREKMLVKGKAIAAAQEAERVKNLPENIAAKESLAVWAKELNKLAAAGKKLPLPPTGVTYETALASKDIMRIARNACLFDKNVEVAVKLKKATHEAWIEALFVARDGSHLLAATG